MKVILLYCYGRVSQFIARHLFGGVEQTERFLGKLTSVLMAWWNWLFRDIYNIVLHIECRYVIARYQI